MEWYPRQHRDPELGGELVRGISHERAADHVLDHAEQRRLPVVGGTKSAAHRVARLGCRDGHGEHGGGGGGGNARGPSPPPPPPAGGDTTAHPSPLFIPFSPFLFIKKKKK